MKRSLKFLAAAFAVSLLFVGNAGATIQKETGFGTNWPADSGGSVVEFTARTAKSTDWKLGHKINGSYADTQDYTWPQWGGGTVGFTLTHDSATGEITLTIDENQYSTASSTTWNSGRASCERVKDIWIRAGSVANNYTSSITVSDIDGQPVDVILTSDENGEINWLHISGEPFKDFTLSGTMSMTWTDGAKEPQKVSQINLISVIFEGDTDGDGFVDGCDNCPAAPNAGQEDCNNNDIGDACDAVNPNATEICDTIDNNCNGQNNEGLSFDLDGDNHSTPTSCEGTKDDCDDTDVTVYPGAPELCDGQDNNCDGTTPADEVDNDGDHYAVCTLESGGWDGVGTVNGGDDCDDTVAAINPGALENCNNGIDDNCNEILNGPDDGCHAYAQGGDGITYDSLQSAYDFIEDGDTIRIQAGEMGGLTLRDVTVTLAGGYDNSSFSEAERNGWTVISAPLIIWQGKVIAEYIIIL